MAALHVLSWLAQSLATGSPAAGIVTRRAKTEGLGCAALEPGSCAAGSRPTSEPEATAQAAAAAAAAAARKAANEPAWLSIADFLARQNLRMVLAARAAQRAEGAPLAGEGAAREARASALPDGKHGDNHPATVTTSNAQELRP